jgi:hypothetical protein
MARLHALVAAITFAAPSLAAGFDVTECHQTVPSHETGFLQVDLVCDSQGGPNVNLGRHSRLEMNGHTISGGYIGVSTEVGRTGEIVGPGEIYGVLGGGASGVFGCAIAPAGKVVIRDVTLRNNTRGIVSVYDYAMKLENVTIIDNADEGIASRAGNLGSAIGPGKGQITARNVTISGNGGNGIEAYGKLSLRDSTVSGNGGDGIVSAGRTFTLQNVDVIGNTGAGVRSTSPKRGKLKDSAATGSGPDGDIAAPIAPKLVASTCEHSVNTALGGTLGICTGD